MSAVVHIAGPSIQIGSHLRQRCSWCGATLIDYALDRVAVAIDPASDPRGDLEAAIPATWPFDALVARDGGMSYVIELPEGERLPEGACGRLAPEATQ